MELTLNFNNESKVLGLRDLTPKLKLELKELKFNFDKTCFDYLQNHTDELYKYLDEEGMRAFEDYILKSNIIDKQEELTKIEKDVKKGKKIELDKDLMAEVVKLRSLVWDKALDAYKRENQDDLNITMTKLLIDRSTLLENEITLINTDNTSDFWQNQACKETVKAYDFFRRGGL